MLLPYSEDCTEGRKGNEEGMPKWLVMESEITISGSMKTTVDLPEKELMEAMKYTGAKTKTEAVARAVADFNQRQRMAALTRHFGTFKDFMGRGDLKRMRDSGRHTI